MCLWVPQNDFGLVPELGTCSQANSSSGDHGDGSRGARVTRYREKKRSRLFSKKIRYEVRKVNAESRPRMKVRKPSQCLSHSLKLCTLFYVTSCNITFLEYSENIYDKVETCDWTGTSDRSTFVPPPRQ
jgi:hypothetical protein